MSLNSSSVCSRRSYPLFREDNEEQGGHGTSGTMKRHSLEGHGPGVFLSSAPGKRHSSPSCPTGGTWTGHGGIGVLGEGYQSPTLSRRWLRSLGGSLTIKSNSSSTNSNEQRRNPRPTKTRQTLERLRLGLRGCVSLAEDEMSDVKSSLSDLSVSSANQAFHGCGRWLKGLEYALSLVESLALEYERLVEMREGVRSMAYAFSVSMGPQRESALANVKAGFRECTEALCEVETKLQKLLGVFQLEIKGIQGFSRLCGGDVFEISLRHGRQKWKARGRVGKDGRQTWDVPRASFRGILDEVIQIKAAELKTLGKELLLGNKFCEITELFSPEPQLMTVNLNPSGSLKLNLLVTWWPLGSNEDSPEILGFGSSSLSISPNRKRRHPIRQDSASDSNGSNTSTLSSIHSVEEEPEPQREATLWERSLRALTGDDDDNPTNKSEQSTEDESEWSGGISNNWTAVDPTGNFILGSTSGSDTVASTAPSSTVNDNALEEDEREDDGGNGSCESVDAVDGDGSGGKGLRISILRLAALLEDIQGHFPELEPLHTHTKTLQRLLKAPSFHSSNSSLNVESALECFDFLDSEETPEKKMEKNDGKSSKTNSELPSSSKITDSGIFLANSDSPTPSSSGRNSGDDEGRLLGEPWDAVLEAHVSSCLKLIHKLGSFGPLRFREKEALRKLQRHSSLIGIVLSHLPDRLSSEDFVSPAVGPIWFRLAGYKLLISGEEATEGLTTEVKRILKAKGHGSLELSQRISQILLGQMMETGEVRAGDKLTRFQMESFLRHTTLEEAVEEIVEEEVLLESLHNSLEDVLKDLPPNRVPPKTVLVYLFRCLSQSAPSDVKAVSEFLTELITVSSRKRQVEEIAAELLESEEGIERRAGIIGLQFMGLTSYVTALSYLAQMDRDETVRKTAEEALRKMGSEAEMSPHGFRGLGLA